MNELIMKIHTITLCGIPIRVDVALGDNDALILRSNGHTECIWPPAVDWPIVFKTLPSAAVIP